MGAYRADENQRGGRQHHVTSTTSPSDLSTMNFKDLFGPKRVCTGLKKMFTMPEKSSERKCFSVVIILSISCTPLGAVPAITNKALSYGYSRRVLVGGPRSFLRKIKIRKDKEKKIIIIKIIILLFF